MENIINIINFIRGLEPRKDHVSDLETPVEMQLALMRQHGLRGTFLVQYDALKEPYLTLLRENSDICEVGMWLEIVQPLVEAAGEVWHGRYPWDWYNDVGYLIGYEPDVRRKILDCAMKGFHDQFGKYPSCVGAWHMDAVSLRHLSEHYGIDACCICREQVGSDGYTLQGGYYNQAYYPSENNCFCPAGDASKQLNVPVFRMLGSDPIYAYDYRKYPYAFGRNTPTLEPIGLGGRENWCDWFFQETFGGNGLAFQYTQAGQENSFGWKSMKNGIEYQFAKLGELAKAGTVKLQTLSESGAWYKSTFPVTPPTTLTALNDWQNEGRQSLWYNSRFWRTNLLMEDGKVFLRDIYLFDDRYREKYLTARCETTACEYRNLPVMDGFLYSSREKRAGVFICQGEEAVHWDDLTYTESNNTAEVTLIRGDERLYLRFTERTLSMETVMPDITLIPVYDPDYVFGRQSMTLGNHNNSNIGVTYITSAAVTERDMRFCFDGFDYGIHAVHGVFNDDYSVTPESDRIEIDFSKRCMNMETL